MNNQEIITQIIEELENTVGLNWPKSKRGKITRVKLIECWSEYRNIQDYEFYGYKSRRTANGSYRLIFSNLNKNNQRIWKSHILYLYNYKYCHKCKSLKQINDFSDNITREDNKCQKCKVCSSNYGKQHYSNTIEKQHERSALYYQSNQKSAFARSAKRRAAKLNRTPIWSDINKIKQIYNDCPKGYHVDHKIPLQGKLVSGLHVPENLQYLTAKENLSKSNKYEVI